MNYGLRRSPPPAPEPVPQAGADGGHLAVGEVTIAAGAPGPVPTPPQFLRSAFRRVHADRRGSIAPLLALATPVLIGFAGLAVDVTDWKITKAAMQGAADRAALAAGLASVRGGDPATNARGIAANARFVDGSGGVTVAVNRPPRSGSQSTNPAAYEVVVSAPARLSFTRLFLSAAPTMSAQAVAIPSAGTCVLLLGTGAGVLDVGGSGALNLPNCDLYNNSPAANGTQLSGGGTVQAKDIFLTGNYTAGGSSRIAASRTFRTAAPAVRDPYAGRSIPAYAGCHQTNLNTNKSMTFAAPGGAPYVFCGGIRTSGNDGTLTFGPGVYIFKNGPLDLQGGHWTVNGPGGVTLVFTGAGGTAQTIKGSSGTVNLTAPSTGPTAGIAIWVDGGVPSDAIDLTGTASVTGAIYAPNTAMSLGGNSGSPCTQLVVKSLSLIGSADLRHDCASTGIADVGGSYTLAE